MKKWLALFLFLVLVFALLNLGCEKKAEVIKIAAIQPITGPNAAVGIGIMNSIQLAVDQANANKVVGEKQIELLKLDDASKPEQGVNAAIKAASDPKVVAVTAHWNSPVALATNDVFHREGLVNLVTSAISYQITIGNDYDEIFRTVTPDNILCEYGARFAVQIKGYKTFFLIDDNTAFGKSLVKFFGESVKKYGGRVVGEESIQVGEKDFRPVLTKTKRLNPDLIFLGGLVTEGALIKTQMVKLAIKSEFMGSGGILSKTFLEIAGEAAEGSISFWQGVPLEKTSEGLKFIEDYNKAGFKDPYEAFGIFGYVSAQVLIEAILRAGLDRRAIIDEMKNGTFETAIGKVSFDQYGDNKLRFISINQVKNGDWVPIYYTDKTSKLVEY